MNDCKKNQGLYVFIANNPIWIVILCFLLSAQSLGANSVKSGSITWTFDQDYPTGQFANGDWYAVGPKGITIISISPEWDGQKNGAQINPLMNRSLQGLDTRISTSGIKYDNTLNVADDLPISIQPNQSIISVVGKDNASRSPWMEEAQVLTVLSATPPENSFRPPYAGTDKTIRGQTTDIDWSWVLDLPHPPNARSPNKAIGNIQIDWWEQWQSSDMKTANTEHTYGRAIAYEAATAVLWLHLSNSRSKKEATMIDIVQRGIDNFGLVKSNENGWWPNGGHNLGRKLPFLIAAKALNDTEMMSYSTVESSGRRAWHEDEQHFYVSSEQIDRQPSLNSDGSRPYVDRIAYTHEHLGIADWTSNRHTELHRATPRWTGWSGSGYRFANGGPNVGQVAAAMLSGLESAWDAPAFFDYIRERYWPSEEGKRQNAFNQIYLFHAEMFEKAVKNNPSSTETRKELPPPEFNLSSGIYLDAQNVVITGTDDASIFYTLDGTEPNENSLRYSQPLNLELSTLVKAIAVALDGTASSSRSLDIKVNDFVSDSTWQNVELTGLGGVLEFSFTANSPKSNVDTVFGFSQSQVENYSEMACLIRFNSEGLIDARNGNSYEAIQSIPYLPDTQHTFLIQIDTNKKNYNVYVRTTKQNVLLVARDYQFRTESLSTQKINYFATKSLYDDPIRITSLQEINFSNEILYPRPKLIFSHATGKYESMTLDLSLASDQKDAKIYYTLDASTPQPGAPSTFLYSDPITLKQSTTVQVVGVSIQNTSSQVETVNLILNEFDSKEDWTNVEIGYQAKSFSFTFSAIAPASNSDSVVGLCTSQASNYSDLACIVRFNDTGLLDARDSDTYRSNSVVEYEPNAEYNFTFTVDLENKRYSVTADKLGMEPIVIAQNFRFRTEQNQIEFIKYLSTRTLAPNSLKLSSLRFPVEQKPATPYRLIVNKDE